LTLWWREFPELQGSPLVFGRHRQPSLRGRAGQQRIAPAGSEQRVWLENQMAALDPGVRLVFVVLTPTRRWPTFKP